MTEDEFLFLASERGRATVAEHVGSDPARVALTRGLPMAATTATQVKYLARAAQKLPSYSSAGCVLPPRAYEQSSSEAAARARGYEGELCIDLTCGLGVDALWLARRFARVVAVERDPLLCEVARHNFALLGAENIEVTCGAAEDFLAGFQGRADLVFVDPDRRNASGRRLYGLEDCAPNVVELAPLLQRAARVAAIKCSPLFDVDMARRLFGDHTLCRVVSLGGECKELLVEIGDHIPRPRIEAEAIGCGRFGCDAMRERPSAAAFDLSDAHYLTIPDVALQKSRTAIDYFRPLGAHIESDNGYALSVMPLDAPLGRSVEILSIALFSPRALARTLRQRGVRRLDILVRDFPISAAEIARRLNVTPGGATAIAFTSLAGKPVAIEVRD
ncbi:MAG: class I SAM-dependent methyltransferase [Rikenellaceae bacterium]|jgi:SAM-dependent methyltransferase|nr:class I SAM-dependent methyltransferase [Rikenellaceae bacterium]